MALERKKHWPRNVQLTADVLAALHNAKEVADENDYETVYSWLVSRLRDTHVALPPEVYERYVRICQAAS